MNRTYRCVKEEDRCLAPRCRLCYPRGAAMPASSVTDAGFVAYVAKYCAKLNLTGVVGADQADQDSEAATEAWEFEEAQPVLAAQKE